MNIYSFIRQQRLNYKTKRVKITDNFDYNQYEVLNIVELYFNSLYASGNLDSLGREKAFFNINKFRVNVATKATAVDVKDIVIESDVSDDYVRSFLLTKENQLWMKEMNMGKFLKDMGHTRSKYGGVLVKKIEHGDELTLHVVPWKDLITDQTRIDKGVIIERHFYTPAEMDEMRGVWDNIDEAIATAEPNKNEMDETHTDDTPGDYIEVFEVHGVLPVAFLKEPENTTADDMHKYSQQVHIVCGTDNYSTDDDGKTEEYGVTLFSGPDKGDSYKYLPWDEVSGRALGVGVVEDSIEAQVWTNDAINKIKEAMELGSKMIYQTTDKTVGKNVLTDLENGDILTLKEGKELSQVGTMTNNIPAFENVIAMWKDQLDRTTSTFEANIGETLPSGTPFQLGSMLNNQGNSIFDYRREEAGIFMQEIYQDWVLPFLIKRLKKPHTLAGDFSKDELDAIDSAFVNFQLKGALKKRRDAGIFTDTMEDMQAEEARIRTKMQATASKRFIKCPKGYYDDIDAKVSIIVTEENQAKAALMQSLSTILQTVASNPGVLQNPVTVKIFNKIMELAGFSPVELQVEPSQVGPQQQPPQQGQPQQQAAPQFAQRPPQPQPQGVPNGQ